MFALCEPRRVSYAECPPGKFGGHRVSTHAFVAAEDMILIPEKFVCMGESRLIGENVTAPRLCATRCMRAEGSLLVW